MIQQLIQAVEQLSQQVDQSGANMQQLQQAVEEVKATSTENSEKFNHLERLISSQAPMQDPQAQAQGSGQMGQLMGAPPQQMMQ
jgi:ABC-type transporter Mla subunit MlaD